MAESVESILKSIGPSLSSDLKKKLMDSGLSDEAARQRISRARGAVRRLKGASLPNREQFLFLDGEFGSEEFIDKLAKALLRCGSSYGVALAGLRARGGSVIREYFPIASGSPVTVAKGKLLHATVEQKLEEFRLIYRDRSSDGDTICVYDGGVSDNSRRAQNIVEEVLLGSIRAWLVKLGWSSTNTLETRGPGKVQKFGQYAWDIVGPCYLHCLTRTHQNKFYNGFLVGDIILNRSLSRDDIKPFLSKWESLKAQNRKNKFQPMIIAESFEADALNELRNKGALIFMPAVLFGEKVMADLKELKQTIENAAAAVAKNPDSVFKLISRISKVEGASLNLRGVVIEMMIAHIFRAKGYSIDIRKVVHDKDHNAAEIDVLANNKKELVLCECKGKSPNSLVDEDEIQEWLEVAVPRIKSWIKLNSSWLPEKRRFEFYSSSGYTDEALELIAETERKHRKQPIRFYDGKVTVGILAEEKEKALVNIFNEQFVAK